MSLCKKNIKNRSILKNVHESEENINATLFVLQIGTLKVRLFLKFKEHLLISGSRWYNLWLLFLQISWKRLLDSASIRSWRGIRSGWPHVNTPLLKLCTTIATTNYYLAKKTTVMLGLMSSYYYSIYSLCSWQF